jgi:fluoride ion exporter CrcB/FEX
LNVQVFLSFVLVGLGSMAGGVSRYGISLWTQNLSVFSIPYGTLISNLAGCSGQRVFLCVFLFCGDPGRGRHCICAGTDAQRFPVELNLRR